MAQMNRETLLRRAFSDPKNYPYGFSRSGDFSIAESQVLMQYGCLIRALADGELQPELPEDHELLQAIHGQRPAQTAAEPPG